MRIHTKNVAVHPALVRGWQNALTVTKEQVANYIPTHVDIKIVGALLAGATRPDEIANFCQTDINTLRQKLEEPVRMRWVSDQITAQIDHRLGIVCAAIFGRAAAGDVAAARLLFERFSQFKDQTAHVVHHKGLDLSHLSDAELAELVSDKLRTVRAVAPLEAEGASSQVQDSGGTEGSVAPEHEAPPGGDDRRGTPRDVAFVELPSEGEGPEEAPSATELHRRVPGAGS